MKLISEPQNKATISNVGEIGEFRIRNSAKAFSILSSGLYANKIRAIIRELSCNAIDSHVAAGNADTPFEVHLPNRLEPWFSIRDYGIGLSHAEVVNIYTTYFESTKTDSNEFIGALGLGSKSPFSYTDNFTVTAIKNGRKGIYTAFINDQGVPSIALMAEESTAEPTGVEVKFSVNQQHDFYKFEQEAQAVYLHFSQHPKMLGTNNYYKLSINYETRDIIPGVHSVSRGHGTSMAVMGNVAYPIEVPNAQTSLEGLEKLLGCGLEMHFKIGELDMQASREGLSYIPKTINAIKAKLVALNSALALVLEKEANAIPNLWERAEFLCKKMNTNLWSAAVKKYVATNPVPTFDATNYGGHQDFILTEEDLASKFNIKLRGFRHSYHNKCYPSIQATKVKIPNQLTTVYKDAHSIPVSSDVAFVVNDTKKGATERAKHHWRNSGATKVAGTVFVLEAADRANLIDHVGFFNAIHNPPASAIVKASDLLKKERDNSGSVKNVSILTLEERNYGNYRTKYEKVWRDAGKFDDFDNTKTYYYLPLKGFKFDSEYGELEIKKLMENISQSGLADHKIYGVRKNDIGRIQKQKNWINLEEHIVALLKNNLEDSVVVEMACQQLDRGHDLRYHSNIASLITKADSPYVKAMQRLVNRHKTRGRYNRYAINWLYEFYAKDELKVLEEKIQKFVDEWTTVCNRYPLIPHLSNVSETMIADYINLVDSQKDI